MNRFQILECTEGGKAEICGFADCAVDTPGFVVDSCLRSENTDNIQISFLDHMCSFKY